MSRRDIGTVQYLSYKPVTLNVFMYFRMSNCTVGTCMIGNKFTYFSVRPRKQFNPKFREGGGGGRPPLQQDHGKRYRTYQCFGSGWIRIQIARLDPDPDPESEIEL